jgi:hypothetical protein
VHEPRFENELEELEERNRELSLVFGPGLYLTDPADVAPTEATLRCTECGREPRLNENAMERWPCDAELLPFCPECAETDPGQQRLTAP